MRKYIKPFIEEEEIELEDIVAASLNDSTDIGSEDPNPSDGNSTFFG